jgi:hypothetical protein
MENFIFKKLYNKKSLDLCKIIQLIYVNVNGIKILNFQFNSK